MSLGVRLVSEAHLCLKTGYHSRYVEHWRQRFAKESVDKIFERVEPKEGDKYFGRIQLILFKA